MVADNERDTSSPDASSGNKPQMTCTFSNCLNEGECSLMSFEGLIETCPVECRDCTFHQFGITEDTHYCCQSCWKKLELFLAGISKSAAPQRNGTAEKKGNFVIKVKFKDVMNKTVENELNEQHILEQKIKSRKEAAAAIEPTPTPRAPIWNPMNLYGPCNPTDFPPVIQGGYLPAIDPTIFASFYQQVVLNQFSHQLNCYRMFMANQMQIPFMTQPAEMPRLFSPEQFMRACGQPIPGPNYGSNFIAPQQCVNNVAQVAQDTIPTQQEVRQSPEGRETTLMDTMTSVIRNTVESTTAGQDINFEEFYSQKVQDSRDEESPHGIKRGGDEIPNEETKRKPLDSPEE